MNVKKLTQILAQKFFENGNYDAIQGGLFKAKGPAFSPAAFDDIEPYFEPEEGFAGLFVQSVGYTSGAKEEEVLIYVTRGSKKALSEIPNELEGVRVRAEVMGKPKAGPAPASSRTTSGHFYTKGLRAACGGSCAPSGERYAGTLGALITEGVSTYALSNNHVFAACNHTQVGIPILGPAPMDAKAGKRAPGEVCRFTNMVELRSANPTLVQPMTVDAAHAIVENAALLSSWQGDEDDGYDTPTAIIAPVAGMHVKKFGRTTGLTFGVVEAFVPTPWTLPYKSSKFTSDVWFQDTWTVRSQDGDPFALPGDSGSLIVTEDGKAAVGLLFAVGGRSERAIFSPISTVLESLIPRTAFSLVGNHGI